jgi:hypothetical protein
VLENKAIKAEIGMETDTFGPRDFHIGFLNTEGVLIGRISVTSETLLGAMARAEDIANELSAADFFITAVQRPLAKVHHGAPSGIGKLFTPLGRLIISFVGSN